MENEAPADLDRTDPDAAFKWLPSRVLDNLKLSAMEDAHWESLREFWRSLPARFQAELRGRLGEKLGGPLPAEFRT